MYKYVNQLLCYLIFFAVIIFLFSILTYDQVGLVSILLVCLAVIIICNVWKSISTILYTALIIRVFFILLGNSSSITLPDSDGDVKFFENQAWLWSKDGFIKVFEYYTGPETFFISWLAAIPYSLFGRNLLMLQSITLFVSILVVLLGWQIGKKLWDEYTAKKIGWLLALYPTIVLYSGLFLRETYIYFFLLISINGIIDWFRLGTIKSFLVTTLGFVGTSFFHGPMLIGYFIFITIVLFSLSRKFLISLSQNRLSKKFLLIVPLIVILFHSYYSGKFQIPKLNDFKTFTNFEFLSERMKLSFKGDATYPQWLVINNPSELIYKPPIKILFFLFSPFPWDVKKLSHLIGLFDSLFFIFLSYLVFFNRKNILNDTALRVILIILITYIIIFTLGVGNFGTGIRHRSKLIFFYIMLIGPLIPKIIFFKRNNSKLKIKSP